MWSLRGTHCLSLTAAGRGGGREVCIIIIHDIILLYIYIVLIGTYLFIYLLNRMTLYVCYIYCMQCSTCIPGRVLSHRNSS